MNADTIRRAEWFADSARDMLPDYFPADLAQHAVAHIHINSAALAQERAA